MTTSEQELPTLDKLTSYSIKIENQLHKRLSKHLNLLKNLEDQRLSMQKWLIEAFIEKIDADESLDDIELIKERYLHFKVALGLNKKVENRVRVVRKFKPFFTKKQWFVEAIYEKLDREEKKAKRLLEAVKDAAAR